MSARRDLPALALALLALASPGGAAAETAPRDLDRGAALYAENCAACHGAKLEGQENWRVAGPDGVLPAPPHDETRLGGQKALEERGITGFESGMPGFGDSLSDDEIRDILAFIRSTWPENIREAQAARSAAEAAQGD